MNHIKKWDFFVKEIANLMFFWFFGILFFSFYRSIFILIYSKEIGTNATIMDFFKTYITGFRFDCTATAYFVVVPLVVTLIFTKFKLFKFIEKTRVVFQYFFVILSPIICIVTLNYYKEYNDQFNMFLFLGLYDDQEAIFKTIVEYYHPILNILAMLIAMTASTFIFRYYSKRDKIERQLSNVKGAFPKTLFVLLTITLFVFSIRGSVTTKPARRVWAATTSDKFLNKTIINPYRTAIYAYKDFSELSAMDGDNPYGTDMSEYGQSTVSEMLEKTAPGTKDGKPKQVFLIIMESYDVWSLMDKYSSFGVSDNLRGIMNEGTSFMNFLPAYSGTMHACEVLATGIPSIGLSISYLASSREPYITSVFQNFNRLGYKTNAFYGGELSWQDFGGFNAHLGCQNVFDVYGDYKGSQIGPWGVNDEETFNYILDHVDADEYSFNFILTLSNHTPFAADYMEKGFPYNSKEDMRKEAQEHFVDGMPINELGHIWYGDWALGQFMEEAKKKYPDALFAFTGDHFGRKFVNAQPNLYENSAVPFVLYGKNVPVQKLETPGSHTDVIPTLIELVAPEGFTYYSFGKSMLSEDKNSGFGFEKMINTDSLYYSPKAASTNSISLETMEEKEADNAKLKNEYNSLMKLAWHYIVRGDSIPMK